MDPDLQVTIRALKCETLTDMVERATGMEEGLRLTSRKRPREGPVQTQSQRSGSSYRRPLHFQQSRSEGFFSGGSCPRCNKFHARGT
ncbi:hypothetical protein Dimus_038992 [Dionaea muscipula]